jgi:hypothetical protein
MMLKMTKVEIELLTDVDKVLFIEQNIRGGMSYINQRFCKAGPATNEKTGQRFHVDIAYLDVNNLYGGAMKKKLPISDFEWVSERDKEALDWENMTADQDVGYIVECDLTYPDELHRAHNSFPLAPERLVIDQSMLSPYAAGKKNVRLTLKQTNFLIF